PGDFIVAADGIPVHQKEDIVRVFQNVGVGRAVRLDIMRGTQRLQKVVTLQELPMKPRQAG
ncbi:MAG: hypothetical protein OWR62_04935, partial [Sulfobacillus thermotolerans]|nr:hypothetical protein [Sulfobacillus thermotolerans]